MRRSEERVLVTHVGSLPRPRELLELLLAREAGGEYDAERLDRLQAAGVSEIVRRQREFGIDVVNDGEFGKTSFLSYVNARLRTRRRVSAEWETARAIAGRLGLARLDRLNVLGGWALRALLGVV